MCRIRDEYLLYFTIPVGEKIFCVMFRYDRITSSVDTEKTISLNGSIDIRTKWIRDQE